tara:strand:+ start:516 stop:1016 length:501 start_codon:yes stop_codon:yes gene_type:complete
MKTPKKTVDERFINKHLISQILDQYTQTIIEEKDIDVRIKGRTREKVDLVKIFCKHAKYNLDLSLTRIGDYLGRDHATVLHACQKYDELFFSDIEFREKAIFFIDRFSSIDGIDRLEPNKEDLMKLVNSASEETRGKWLRLVRKTELLMKYPSEIEVVESEIVAHE